MSAGGARPVPELRGPPPAPRPPGELTVGGVLEAVAARHGAAPALAFEDPVGPGGAVRWSYADLRSVARRVAAALVVAGLDTGGRVGILAGNRPEAVAAALGTALAGGIAVPLSTFSTRQELADLVARSRVEILITQRRLRRRRPADDVSAAIPPPWPAARWPYLRRVVVIGEGSWEDFLAAGDQLAAGVVDARAAAVEPGDPALVVFTSGTSEVPKGVLHSHRGTALQFWHQADLFGRHPGTRVWTALPWFWTAGFNSAMGATLAAGACWVMQESFEPGEAISLIEREAVTEPYLLPHQMAALAGHPSWGRADFGALRCAYGTSAFPRHPTVTPDPGWSTPVGYGLTETGAFFCAHRYDAPRHQRRASMGRLLPGNRLRVVDPDRGTPLGPGREGELAVRGPTLMERYLGRHRDDCLDDDGFFRTGDAGSYDDAGWVRFAGRRSEVIKTGGANVSPAELEVALRAHPAVTLARAVGVDDDLRGQVVVLCVVAAAGSAVSAGDITSFLAERLAPYKLPRHVVFMEEGEMPMTASGTKVRDDRLRDVVRRRLEGSAR